MREAVEVTSILGRTISQVRRVVYEFQGNVTLDGGPLELTLDDGACIVFDAGPDGETLVAWKGPWIDPFREPMSDVNRQFVERSGKWTVEDGSNQPPYEALIGQRIAALDDVLLGDGKLIGIRVPLHFGYFEVRTGADELNVSFDRGLGATG